MAVIDIAGLSRDEKLELIEELWESLSQEADAIPLTDAQREELDRRLEELDRDERAGVSPLGEPAEQVLARIRSQRK